MHKNMQKAVNEFNKALQEKSPGGLAVESLLSMLDDMIIQLGMTKMLLQTLVKEADLKDTAVITTDDGIYTGKKEKCEKCECESFKQVEAKLDKKNKVLYIKAKKEAFDEKYLKYLLEHLKIPTDVTIVFQG